MRRALAALLLLTTAANAEPVNIQSSAIADFQRISAADDASPLQWRGGLTLTADAPQFGGLSGLVLSSDCTKLTAVSDKGEWLRGTLQYEGKTLSGFSDAMMTPMLDSNGKPLPNKRRGDAEAVSRLNNGKLAVAFESVIRFGSYDGVTARFKAIPHPKDIDTGPGNGAVEAFGQLPDGRFLAISEDMFDAQGNIRAWAWKGPRTTPFALKRYDAYRVTDLAVMPEGTVLTLERRFEMNALPGMAIRRFSIADIKKSAVLEPELLLEAAAPLQVIDNMEGIALCQRDDETRVTLISDDNFNRSIQSTILLQFALKR